MSILGKIFILGLFAASVYSIGTGFRFGYQEMRERHRQGKSWSVGLFGGLIWFAFFIFRNLYGWGAAIGLLVMAGVALFLVVLILRLFSRSASEQLLAGLDSDYWAEWAVGFLFIGLAVGWCYFLMFAPFGVLCVLGLRTCGVRWLHRRVSGSQCQAEEEDDRSYPAAPAARETEPINYNPLPRGIHGKSKRAGVHCAGVEDRENESGE
jgi:hypothetical protein